MDSYIWYCDDCNDPATGEEGMYHLAYLQDDGSYSDADGDVVIEAPEVDADGEWVRDAATTKSIDFREQQDEWMHYLLRVATSGVDYLDELIHRSSNPHDVADQAFAHAERIAQEQGFPLPERPEFVGRRVNADA